MLDYDARQKHRFRATLASGEVIAVRLPRGTVLVDGNVLVADDGGTVRVVAAAEPLSVATTNDPLLLARVAYHLGNRHVPLQIAPGRVAYVHDHVLDDLATRLGATVSFERAPFNPEGGAYGLGGHHSHEHDHDPDHHGHEHDHDPDHHGHDHEHGAP